jgi:hypothetical protein
MRAAIVHARSARQGGSGAIGRGLLSGGVQRFRRGASMFDHITRIADLRLGGLRRH